MGKKYDLVGQKFHCLKVVGLAEPKMYKCGLLEKRWLCKCDCGNETDSNTTLLLRGIKKSCGCKAYQLKPHKNSKIDPKDVSKNTLFRRYINTARKRNIDWHIKKEEFFI